MTSGPDLRLSAQRAFLGRIVPSMRLIKAEVKNGVIILTCLTDRPPTAVENELVSEAATEIISDFPTADIQQIVQSSNQPLPREDVLAHGWIFERYEGHGSNP